MTHVYTTLTKTKQAMYSSGVTSIGTIFNNIINRLAVRVQKWLPCSRSEYRSGCPARGQSTEVVALLAVRVQKWLPCSGSEVITL